MNLYHFFLDKTKGVCYTNSYHLGGRWQYDLDRRLGGILNGFTFFKIEVFDQYCPVKN